MGIGILTVTIEGAGEEWSNTWGVGDLDAANFGPLNEADVATLVGGVDFGNPEATDPTETSSYQGPTNVIAAIVGFTRYITIQPAVITRLYLGDGTKNSEGANPTSVFWTAGVNLPALSQEGAGVDGVVVPLSIAWLLNRNPVGFSQRAGRLYLRHALVDASVRPGTRDGVQWQSAAAAEAANSRLSTALSISSLEDYFGATADPTGSGVGVGIPKYYRQGTANAGEIQSLSRIAGLSSHDPVSRQLTRGRRRTPAGQ